MTEIVSIAGRKRSLRARCRSVLRSLSPHDLVAGKMGIFETLWKSPLLHDGTRLLAFYPHGHEIDIRYFLRVWLSHEREVAIPRVAADGESLSIHRLPNILAVTPGYRGMLEPDQAQCPVVDADEIDAILLPGLAYTTDGLRLGQGGGHYDRLLATMGRSVVRIGACYDWQVLDAPASFAPGAVLEGEAHDELVDYLCTPSGLIKCQERRRTDV